MFLLNIFFELTIQAASLFPSITGVSNTQSRCKSLPGDKSWPSAATWDAFNTSVDGRLIRTVPIGSPCHGSAYNAEECNYIQDQWHQTTLHEKSSSSMMTPFFANKSCDPFTGREGRCVIGTYVQYAVNVSAPSHIVKTLDFVRRHNIRFVVRNTGHDYMGKSTGAGALSIWTRHLKDTEWIENFSSPKYRGPAVKAGAGVSAQQLYEEADARGLVIVGGECTGVGFTGGYIQGGGHSALSSMYGLAADQTLSFEVITTTGKFVVASPTENSDLYWALSGGGGGTYGIVWSVTVKAYPDSPVTIAGVMISSTQNISRDVWWEAFSFYQASTPTYTDAGAFVIASYNKDFFRMGPFFTPNKTQGDVRELVRPFLEKLDSLDIVYEFTIDTYPGFLVATESVPTDNYEVGLFQFGGRLLPRSLWQSKSGVSNITAVIRNIIEGGGWAFDVALKTTLEVAGHPDNAVLPAWRDNEHFLITLLPWDDYASWEDVLEQRKKVTWTFGEPLRQLVPDSGTYLNEADSSEPNWQQEFYGSNYARLLKIKDKWDPDQLLYGTTAVSGDRWAENTDGRLCRV